MKTQEVARIPATKTLLGMTLVKRVDNYALYATNCRSFEVHIVRTVTNHYDKWSDTLTAEKEILASSEEFGTHAWSYDRLSTVYRYFGMFGEHHDEIVRTLHENGFTLIEDECSQNDCLGYLL